MKHCVTTFGMILCMALLAGCQKEKQLPEQTGETSVQEETFTEETATAEETLETESAEESVSEGIPLTLYLSNENADGFVQEEVCISELDENLILEQLILKGALPEGVAVNAFSQDGKELTLDMNQAFADYAGSMGTTGEYFAFGCLVNTFLDAFDTESIMITAEGDVISTGHNIYEEPFGKVE